MYEDTLKIYDELVSKVPGLERKGKTMPYTSSNGYMFSLLNKDGELGIRLPKELGSEFMEKYNSGPFKSHGATMRDYVLIPDDLLTNQDLLADYLKQSWDYVNTLEPK